MDPNLKKTTFSREHIILFENDDGYITFFELNADYMGG